MPLEPISIFGIIMIVWLVWKLIIQKWKSQNLIFLKY